jgi:hypothetical protein
MSCPHGNHPDDYWQEEARRYAANADFWREKAQRQPLTEAEINDIERDGEFWDDHSPLDFARAIEAKLREKNT